MEVRTFLISLLSSSIPSPSPTPFAFSPINSSMFCHHWMDAYSCISEPLMFDIYGNPTEVQWPQSEAPVPDIVNFREINILITALNM